MKNIFKTFSIGLVLAFCIIVSGCSCSSPMKVSYKIRTGQGNLENVLTTNLNVYSTVIKKFREPIGTPCYRKVEGEKYTELTTINERYRCYDENCYIKSGDGYELMSKNIAAVEKCITGSVKCYEYSEKTYYRLLEAPDNITQCYTEDGEPFEIQTNNTTSQLETEAKKAVVSKLNNKLEHDSETYKVFSEKNYSLIYQFEIQNNENKTIYIEALEYDDITNDLVKNGSYEKLKITFPENRVFIDNKFYYIIPANSEVTIKIEIKHLLTSDIAKKGTKILNLNIPIIVK